MNFQYKKSLGQNFLIDNNIIDKISNSINPSSNDLIIEIGLIEFYILSIILLSIKKF